MDAESMPGMKAIRPAAFASTIQAVQYLPNHPLCLLKQRDRMAFGYQLFLAIN